MAGDTGDVGPRKAPLGARANRRWLLSWRLGTHTPPNPHITLRRAPPYVDIYEGGQNKKRVRRLHKFLTLREITKSESSEPVEMLRVSEEQSLLFEGPPDARPQPKRKAS